MDFRSDNVTGAAPQILAALASAGAGTRSSYGEDQQTRRVEAALRELFQTELAVCFVATGTAANSLGLALLSPPWGQIYCHQDAHVAADECGAPEFYTGGAKLCPLPGEHGRIRAEQLAALLPGNQGVVHQVQPAAVSLSQATEAGTSYRPADIAAIAEVAHRHGLRVHMDGARFANSLVFLGTTAADLTWRAGVDVLSFGASKNGALAAEAVIVFDPTLAASLAYRRKRGGHLLSKMRLLSAQLEAYLADGLWLQLARHANAMAARLAAGLAGVPGVRLCHPVEANEVFVEAPEPMIRALLADGFQFYRWPGEHDTQLRLVAAFDTRSSDVEALIGAAARHAKSAERHTGSTL